MGYVITFVLAFALGIAVTLLIDHVRKYKEETREGK